MGDGSVINLNNLEGLLDDETTFISSFTITNGHSDDILEGGGISVRGSPRLYNLDIINNLCTSHGGGIAIAGESNAVIQNVLSAENTATRGGGLYRNGTVDGSQTLINVTIKNNTSTE